MKILVGLGNPGKKYINTRHNVGFMMVDKIAKSLKLKAKNNNSKFKINKKFNAETLKLNARRYSLDADLLLVKPQAFMNSSGEAVVKVSHFYKIKPKDIWLVHDDLDIELGEYKIQFGKGPKQHNGLLSVEKELGTKDFWRIRIGIGINNKFKSLRGLKGLIKSEDYVLGKFSKEEKKIVNGVINKVIKEKLFYRTRDRCKIKI